MMNQSGLDRTAQSMCEAEVRLGIDSRLCNAHNEATWTEEILTDVDVHVCHVHFPDRVRARLTKPAKVVWIGHGTPEYSLQTSMEEGQKGGYGFSDSFMLMQYWLQHADARVTFWPRHRALYQTMVDTGTPVHLVPMGVDREFWTPGLSRGKWGGSPSVFTAENAHWLKWPVDLLLLWPWVAEQMHEATLHVCNLPRDQHRWLFPLVNRNGAAFRTHLSDIRWGKDDLRNVFRSIDFFIGLVRYGDWNQLSMQAAAAGSTTISYRGNVYADYWLTEGSQINMAAELLAILRGDIEPRAERLDVPDIMATASAMQAIYEDIA